MKIKIVVSEISFSASVSQRLIILCIMSKIIAFLIIRMFARLSVRISILLPCNAWSHHFYGWVRAHETSVTLTLFIEVPVPSQESIFVFVLGVSILPFYSFDIHVIDFGNVAKVQYVLSIEFN